MSDEHTNGAISKAQGRLEAALGKLTGNRRQQIVGKARQVKGGAQVALGDIQQPTKQRNDKP